VVAARWLRPVVLVPVVFGAGVGVGGRCECWFVCPVWRPFWVVALRVAWPPGGGLGVGGVARGGVGVVVGWNACAGDACDVGSACCWVLRRHPGPWPCGLLWWLFRRHVPDVGVWCETAGVGCGGGVGGCLGQPRNSRYGVHPGGGGSPCGGGVVVAVPGLAVERIPVWVWWWWGVGVWWCVECCIVDASILLIVVWFSVVLVCGCGCCGVVSG